jgi:hypothetical protein
VKSILVYEDKAKWGLLLKAIVIIVPAVLIVMSLYMWTTGNGTAAPIFLVEALVIGVIFWAVFPRKYQIYEDQVRIVLGGSFSVKIKFDKIQSVGTSNNSLLGMNFATRVTNDYVAITRTNKTSVNITPYDTKLFIVNLNRALDTWKSTQPHFTEQSNTSRPKQSKW